MAWTPWDQSPKPPAKRRSGTPQLVIGIVLIGLVLLSRAANPSSPLPSDPAELAGYLFFEFLMIGGGVVLIIIGARIKSRNNKADLIARQQQAQFGWQAQPGPYGQQPGPYGQQPGPYGQQQGQQPGPYDWHPDPYGQLPGQPGAYEQPRQQGPYGQYGQPWQPDAYGPPQSPESENRQP